MKILYITIFSLSSILFFSCNNDKKNASTTNIESVDKHDSEDGHDHDHDEVVEVEVTEAQIKAVDITLGKIEKKDLNNTIRVNGEMALDPQKKAEVTSLVSGIVKQILVIEGQNVSAGQTVAYLENTAILEIQKNYLTTKRESQIAEQEYNRQKTLFAQGAGIEKTLQQASANYEIAKAQLTGLEKQLRQLSISPSSVESGNLSTQIPIKSPITGCIGRINVSTGSYVDTQTSLMNVTDNTNIHCDVRVFEKDINLVKKGQDVEITLTNQPQIKLKGEVYEINQSFEGNAKDIIVHVNIKKDRGDLNLIPGMYVTALIKTGIHETDAVPNDAIANNEGKKYIFVLEKETEESGQKVFHFKKEEVITGISETGYTQIEPVSILAEDATIVTQNAFYLSSMSSDHGEHSH